MRKTSVIRVILFIILANLVVLGGSQKISESKIKKGNDIPKKIVYAHVFNVIVSFDKKGKTAESEENKLFWKNYFKNKVRLTNNDYQILKRVAENFYKEFNSSATNERIQLSLQYWRELKKMLNSNVISRFDTFIEDHIIPDLNFYNSSNLSFSYGSSISIDEQAQELRGSSDTTVFTFSASQLEDCSVSATMSGPSVSVSGSDSNCNGVNPTVDLVSTSYLAEGWT